MKHQQRADGGGQAEGPDIQAPPPSRTAQRQQAERTKPEPQGDGACDPRRRNQQGREDRAALEADYTPENQRGGRNGERATGHGKVRVAVR